jgi:hypothetical protein
MHSREFGRVKPLFQKLIAGERKRTADFERRLHVKLRNSAIREPSKMDCVV